MGDEQRRRDLGFLLFACCVRAGCHQERIMVLCAEHSYPTALSFKLNNLRFLPHSPSSPSFFLPAFRGPSVSHTLTSSHSVPSLLTLCTPPPSPSPFLVFFTLCACVSAMWLTVPLSGLYSMCATWRRRRCGVPTGSVWASSPLWVLALACTLSSFIW